MPFVTEPGAFLIALVNKVLPMQLKDKHLSSSAPWSEGGDISADR